MSDKYAQIPNVQLNYAVVMVNNGKNVFVTAFILALAAILCLMLKKINLVPIVLQSLKIVT